MRKDETIEYFGSVAELARCIGQTRRSIELWPELVQVGNETNPELAAGPKKAINWTRNALLLNAGLKAVREAARDSPRECWVVQRFVPQQSIATPFGARLVTLGVYVLDGRFSGYFARLSPFSHVSHEALCVPVFTRVPPLPAPPRVQSNPESALDRRPPAPPPAKKER